MPALTEQVVSETPIGRLAFEKGRRLSRKKVGMLGGAAVSTIFLVSSAAVSLTEEGPSSAGQKNLLPGIIQVAYNGVVNHPFRLVRAGWRTAREALADEGVNVDVSTDNSTPTTTEGTAPVAPVTTEAAVPTTAAPVPNGAVLGETTTSAAAAPAPTSPAAPLEVPPVALTPSITMEAGKGPRFVVVSCYGAAAATEVELQRHWDYVATNPANALLQLSQDMEKANLHPIEEIVC